jgi:hypothetical protein
MPSATPDRRGASDPIVDKTVCQMRIDFKRHTALPILGFCHPRASKEQQHHCHKNRNTCKQLGNMDRKKYHHPKWHHRQSSLQIASYREVKINLCQTLDELEIKAFAIPFVACRQG